MKIDDIAKLHHLVEVHIRLSDAINVSPSQDQDHLKQVQCKVVQEMKKLSGIPAVVTSQTPVPQPRRRVRGLGLK